MIKEYLHDFIKLFFPSNCCACGNSLLKNENIICTSCLYHIPKTNFHTENENPVHQIFWGRVKIEKATAFYYFLKNTNYQHIIHHLKYKGQHEIGVLMGQYFASDLLESDFHKDIDLIIPVPLHPKKQKMRGYNQSEMIAKGLSDVLERPMDTSSLRRSIFTESQTRKSRIERWINVETVFEVAEPQQIAHKHILLIDDVLTTGSTLEACAIELLKVEGVKVSIAVLAFARN